MGSINWAYVDIEDELRCIEALLSASLYLNSESEQGRQIIFELVDIVLTRVRELKAASEVQHA
ncbi:hypothetical protein RHD99_14785 [Buttiauxella selenatireducens]|uniref:Uncharacterized protein n=1 Tax=Buttiauxella selenatireducens TaxID=3073902 RepID=A0ABY9S5E6_9ENTR|nr:hypothetical protein [Buttiauxella sp. R73]WMY72737.1 hypothetical protein RHD99_14785 [Buttiauxella sp. R73]